MREYLDRMWESALAAFATAVEDQDGEQRRDRKR
jgi:hypothetical protein